jgi:predicted nucleic acid-binding protein
MLSQGKASGSLMSDAHLAALAAEHGATLYSTDRDFAQFPNLKFENPLES